MADNKLEVMENRIENLENRIFGETDKDVAYPRVYNTIHSFKQY